MATTAEREELQKLNLAVGLAIGLDVEIKDVVVISSGRYTDVCVENNEYEDDLFFPATDIETAFEAFEKSGLLPKHCVLISRPRDDKWHIDALVDHKAVAFIDASLPVAICRAILGLTPS